MFTIISCEPAFPNNTEELTSLQQDGDECIPPVVEWEFPLMVPKSMESAEVIPPTSEWEVQVNLPEKTSSGYLALIEQQQGYDVIWIRANEKYFRFRTDTQQWSSISFDGMDENVFHLWLFQDQNGEVWALSDLGYVHFLHLTETNRFEIVDDIQIPVARIGFEYLKPIERMDNTLWFFMNDGPNKMSLYSVNLQTKQAESHLTGEINEYSWSISIGLDGSIFIVKTKDNSVIRYDPDSKVFETILYSGNFEKRFSLTLFNDKNGVLWINDYIWTDFQELDKGSDKSVGEIDMTGLPTWHHIIRSPVFIVKGINSVESFTWVRPRPMIQSSDGRIWFDGFPAGLVWLDPERGFWCKFTTIQSNILEDQNEDLWLLYDNKLYKNIITP